MPDSEEDWCAALRVPQCQAKGEMENDALRTDGCALPHSSKEMSDSEEDWCAALRGPQCQAKAEMENDALRTDGCALSHVSKHDRTQHFYAAARTREAKERKRRRRAEGSHVQSLKKWTEDYNDLVAKINSLLELGVFLDGKTFFL